VLHQPTAEMPHNLKLVLLAYLFATSCYEKATGFSFGGFDSFGNGPGRVDTMGRKASEAGSDSSSEGRWSSYRRRQRKATHLGSSTTSTTDVVVNGDETTTTTSLMSEAKGSMFWPSNRIRKKDDSKKQCDYYDEVFDSIVKIYATHNYEPDTTMPWQKRHSYTSYSSGFVIDGRQIITNAHSVEYAGQVLVRRRGTSKKYRAKIEIVANECDLAVLTIEDETFWTTQTDYGDVDDEDLEDEDDEDVEDDDDEDEEEDDDEEEAAMEDREDGADSTNDDSSSADSAATVDDTIMPLQFGELPQLQDEVEVLGYPTGGDSLSVTKGVVSRIEATEYAQCSGSHLLAIQIDAAINGGNSGGPVVDATTGKVVGVAFQSLDEAENIGYVVPVTVVLHFLEDIRRHGRYSGTTCLGIRFAKLENESMRSYLKLPKDSTKKGRKGVVVSAKGGVTVRGCYPTCPAKDVLKENDVILSIDGIPVASDGNVPFRRNGRERVSFGSYIQTKFADETVRLDLWRDGRPVSVEVPLAISKNLVPSHWDNQAVPYVIVGGLVFSVLSVPYLEDQQAWGEYVSDSLSYLSNKVNEYLEREDDQIVFLINVLAHPKNTGYDDYCDMHLTSCNGTKVRSLRHFQDLVKRNEEEGGEYLRLEFGSASTSTDADVGGGTLVVLETKSIEKINEEVCEEHSIQNPFYFPPPRS